MGSWRDRLTDTVMLAREDRRADPSLWMHRSSLGMVATAHYQATRAGVEVLEEGGNAVDAALAASLALVACEPAGSGLAGMALMLMHLAEERRTFLLAGACRAPSAATPEAVVRADRRRGHSAVAVPAYLKVVEAARSRYGTLDHRRLLEPAIRLAEKGYRLTRLQRRLLVRYRAALAEGGVRGIGLDEGGSPLEPGSPIVQPLLATTLRRLADAGLEDFYRGDIARAIDRDMRHHGGFLGAADLAALAPPDETEPISGRFRDLEVLTLPPPAGGLNLLQMLHTAEALGEEACDLRTPEGVVRVAAVIRRARRDRRRFRLQEGADDPLELRGEPEFGELAADRVRARLRERGETTHLSVFDRRGNAVSITQSLERSFGAAVMAEGLGFLYNGYLATFKVQNRRHPHFLRPGATARSNASPTIALRDGRAAVAIGSTGSERMVSGMFEVLLRLWSEDPFEAVHAPRLHCTPGGLVLLEAKRFPAGTLAALRRHRFRSQALGRYSFQVGGLQLVVREGNDLIGVAEPRRDGAAAGPDRLVGAVR